MEWFWWYIVYLYPASNRWICSAFSESFFKSGYGVYLIAGLSI